jgi:hypothetical protein
VSYRLDSTRLTLDLGGPTVEVERLAAPTLRVLAMAAVQRVMDAKTDADQASALFALGQRLADEAQPVWDILDHRGAVPPTAAGFIRLPVDLALSIAVGWLEESAKPLPSSAVDALVEPGPLNTALKRKLAAKRREAEKAAA